MTAYVEEVGDALKGWAGTVAAQATGEGAIAAGAGGMGGGFVGNTLTNFVALSGLVGTTTLAKRSFGGRITSAGAKALLGSQIDGPEPGPADLFFALWFLYKVGEAIEESSPSEEGEYPDDDNVEATPRVWKLYTEPQPKTGKLPLPKWITDPTPDIVGQDDVPPKTSPPEPPAPEPPKPEPPKPYPPQERDPRDPPERRTPASEKQAKAIAKQIEKDLGKDARRDFHDAKDRATGDRTLKELKEDARAIYEAIGKEPPLWLR